MSCDDPVQTANEDARFTDLLAHYGEATDDKEDGAVRAELSVPPALRLRLERALSCLRRLRQARPGSGASAFPVNNSPPSIDAIEPSPALRIGRFRLRRVLGQGGGGLVFLAYDPDLRRRVALKVPLLPALFRPGAWRRLRHEARAVARLDHPGLVPLYEMGQANGLGYLISPYYPVGSLADWLVSRSKPVSPRRAAALGVLLAETLHYVHKRGIYHCDIKPSNILLDRGEGSRSTSALAAELGFRPRLTDFGLAEFGRCRAEPKEKGAATGTPDYMAPEQAEGRFSAIGPATDIYALGVVLYEILAGRPPFAGGPARETLRRAICTQPASLQRWRADVPLDLEALCLKCLQKEPARRYAQGGQLADDLRRFLDG